VQPRCRRPPYLLLPPSFSMSLHLTRWKAPWSLLLALTACADLEVMNLNDPDVGRSLGTPSEVLSLIGGSFHSWFRGNYNTGTTTMNPPAWP